MSKRSGQYGHAAKRKTQRGKKNNNKNSKTRLLERSQWVLSKSFRAVWFHDHNLSYQQSHNRSCCVSEDMASGLPASVSWYTRNPLLLLLQSAHSTFFLPQQSLCNETVPVHRREGRCVTHDTSPQRLCSSLGLLKKKRRRNVCKSVKVPVLYWFSRRYFSSWHSASHWYPNQLPN